MLLVILSVGGLDSPAAAANTPKPTPTPGLKIEITPVVTPITGDGKTVGIALDQPFVLRPGQTARNEAEDVSLTLRSLTEDSGCFSADDCSVMLAEGTLAMQAGEDKELLEFSAGMTPGSPFSYEFGDYVITLLRVEASEHGKQLATFVISGTQPAEVGPNARGQTLPGFTRFDAAAILQADAKAGSIANLVFALCPAVHLNPQATVHTTLRTRAPIPSSTPPHSARPHRASAVGTAYAAVADRLAGDETLQLLHLLALVSGGEEMLDSGTLLQLQTQLGLGHGRDSASPL